MEPLVYVMAIVGCADSGAACSEERMVERRYVSAAECNAATEEQLILNSDIEFPVIRAQCRRADSTTIFAENRARRR